MSKNSRKCGNPDKHFPPGFILDLLRSRERENTVRASPGYSPDILRYDGDTAYSWVKISCSSQDNCKLGQLNLYSKCPQVAEFEFWRDLGIYFTSTSRAAVETLGNVSETGKEWQTAGYRRGLPLIPNSMSWCNGRKAVFTKKSRHFFGSLDLLIVFPANYMQYSNCHNVLHLNMLVTFVHSKFNCWIAKATFS
jgi:hypothetical protein